MGQLWLGKKLFCVIWYMTLKLKTFTNVREFPLYGTPRKKKQRQERNLHERRSLGPPLFTPVLNLDTLAHPILLYVLLPGNPMTQCMYPYPMISAEQPVTDVTPVSSTR